MADKKIDPRLYLPPLDGYEYEDKKTRPRAEDRSEVLDLPSPTTGLYPPDGITVVEQVFRKGADGRTVVDLVIEVDDVPNASSYEVRSAII